MAAAAGLAPAPTMSAEQIRAAAANSYSKAAAAMNSGNYNCAVGYGQEGDMISYLQREQPGLLIQAGQNFGPATALDGSPVAAGEIDAGTARYLIDSYVGDSLSGKSTQYEKLLTSPFAQNYTDPYGNVILAQRQLIVYAPKLNLWARTELQRMYGKDRIIVVDTLPGLLSAAQSPSF